MSIPLSYPFCHGNASQREDNAVSDLMGSTAATTATLTDGGSTYNGIDTPSITNDGINTPTISYLADNASRGTPSVPEPTVLLSQIQEAADEVSRLVGRFGY